MNPQPRSGEPSEQTEANEAAKRRLGRWQKWAALAGIFLLIFSAKLWVIGKHGNSMPSWDQWGAEGEAVLVPFVEGRMEPGRLFIPHNEHRIFFTRLLGLGLLKLNGIWDSKVEMAAQALIHAAGITLLAGLCGIAAGNRGAWLAFLAFVAAVFMLPFGWENTLWGFQSHFYFALFWGSAGIFFCWRHDTLSRGWWAGVLVLSLGLISMAGGIFAPLAAAGVALLRAARCPREWRRHLAGAAVLAVMFAAGALLVPHVEMHDALKARSLGEFFKTASRLWSWPAQPQFLLLAQAPFVLLTAWAIRRRPADDPAWLLVTLGVWCGFQTVATAYSRAAMPGLSRYADNHSLALCVSFICLLCLANRLRGRIRIACLLLVAAWLGVMGRSLAKKATHELPVQLADRHDVMERQAGTVREFVAAHDLAVWNARPPLEIPYPDRAILSQMLVIPAMRAILPTEIRQPLTPVSVETRPQGAFRRGGAAPGVSIASYEQAWGTHDAAAGGGATGRIDLDFPAGGRTTWLALSVAGSQSSEGIAAWTLDAQGRERPVAMPARLGPQWQTVYFRRPEGRFTLRVADESTAAWATFTLPREAGPLTVFNEWLLRRSVPVGLLGLALFIGAAGLQIARSLRLKNALHGD